MEYPWPNKDVIMSLSIIIEKKCGLVSWSDESDSSKDKNFGHKAYFQKLNEHSLKITHGDQSFFITFAKDKNGNTWIKRNESFFLIESTSRRKTKHTSQETLNESFAPMPGKVLRQFKNDGDQVSVNETILILEAMKMELPIKSGLAGKLRLSASVGQQVSIGDKLFIIE